MILWNFWLCDSVKLLTYDSMKDSGYVCIWTYSVFILPKEYWWIGCGGPAPKFWFFRGHSVLVLSRTFCSGSFGIQRGFSGARDLHKTTYVLLCSEWLSMKFTNLVRQYNIHGDPNHMFVSFLLCALCICIRYLLSAALTFILTLQMTL